MSQKLSQYSQTLNTASTSSVSDANSPYSFQDWLIRNVGIVQGKERIQYEKYVKDWYQAKQEEPTTRESIKEDYIQLLKQLAVVFKSEADSKWATDVDFDDPNDVEQVIPFYATKLKEIAIYFINKREAVRRAKLKYNMVGTEQALERVFHEYLLKAFTKKQVTGNEYTTTITDLSVLNAVPELSAVNTDFQITVDELYDDATYFDRSPSLPASAYYTFNADVTAYLDTLNIDPDQYEWLYSTGVSNICADNPLLWSIDAVLDQYKNGIPLSAVELYDSTVLNDYNRIKLAKKYFGTDLNYISGGYWSTWVKNFSYNIQQGNNWFYWVSGQNPFEVSNQTIDPLMLSASNLIDSGATAGDTISSADLFYATRNGIVSGAWLRRNKISTFSAVMSARLTKGRTAFSFPYPGYGLSGEDLDWTGKSFDNIDQTFYYLDEDQQSAVYNAYWSTVASTASSFSPIYINDTKLIECSAKPSDKFNTADYVIRRPTFRDSSPDGIYNSSQEYAWLYKMTKTDLPIQVGKSKIYWPIERFTDSISSFVSSNHCTSRPLSSISLSAFDGSVAGFHPSVADKIYKLPTPNSTVYTEGAWLRGAARPLPTGITITGIVSSCYQPNLSIRVTGGSYGSFVWEASTTSANNIFYNKPHQSTCDYLTHTQFSLYRERPTHQKDINYNQWQDCSCRSVVYSPLGHPGSSFDDYDQMADFIVAITSPVSSFSFKTWRGIDGNTYKTSNEFGWFKLNNSYSVEPDVGWGSGNWVTYTGTPFMLSANVMYMYYRSEMHRDNPTKNVPYLVVRHSYSSTPNNSWRKLVYDNQLNEWVDAGVSSDMIIQPSDILEYDHQTTRSVVLTTQKITTSQRSVFVAPSLSSIAANVNISPLNLPSTSIAIPIQAFDENTPITSSQVYTLCTLNIPLYGELTGTIPVSAQITNLSTQTNTSILSTLSSLELLYYIYSSDATNFILNAQLSGWNYNTSRADRTALGCRPIWVYASDEENDYTKNKGTDIWSGSPVLVDEYNFITQPPFSRLKLEGDDYVEYVKRDNGIMVWVQPISGTFSTENKQWCKIDIDTSGVSNLSSILHNNINNLLISATYQPADITLEYSNSDPLIVNYFARSPFTWSQRLTDSSLGLPPTGGVWTPIASGVCITPDAPYAYLSNRHYPTYASAPFVGELYAEKDSGGYFIPKNLGITTAVSKNRVNELSTNNISNNLNERGTTSLYRDLNVYTSDRGFTQQDQIEPVETVSVDSEWMKASIVQGQKAGMIVNARQHQEFMPYQSRYENIGSNDNGLYRQGEDSIDPWFRELDSVWENNVDWPKNWRGQYDIQGWYEQQNNSNQQVYQWKTDIFGNQYAVLKLGLDSATIHNKKHTIPGTIWTRSSRNIVVKGDESLAGVFEAIPAFSGIDISSMSNTTSSVLDIDVWYDTLMVYTSSALFTFHINFDFTDGTISSTSDESNYILLNNSKFGGTWFHEDDKKVTICTLASCGDQIRPVLRSLNLDTNELTYLYNLTASQTSMSAYNLTGYDHPVFTYDKASKIYNISYAGYNNTKSGMYLTTINIKDYGVYCEIASAKTIVPEA